MRAHDWKVAFIAGLSVGQALADSLAISQGAPNAPSHPKVVSVPAEQPQQDDYAICLAEDERADLEKRLTGIEMLGLISGIGGIIASSMGLVNSIGSWIPKKRRKPGTAFRFYLGQKIGADHFNSGGRVPRIRVFDIDNIKTGERGSGDRIDRGQSRAQQVLHTQQAITADFEAEHDTLCIALIQSKSDPDRVATEYAVTGDFGYLAGGRWYYSGIIPSKASSYSPRCFWLYGGDEKWLQREIPHNMFRWRLTSFASEMLHNQTNGTEYCLSGAASLYKHDGTREDDCRLVEKDMNLGIMQGVPQEDIHPGEPVRDHWIAQELGIAERVEDSAPALCNHPNSWGPDFKNNHEKLFCDMTNRRVYPYCNSTNPLPCFDTGVEQDRTQEKGRVVG